MKWLPVALVGLSAGACMVNHDGQPNAGTGSGGAAGSQAPDAGQVGGASGFGGVNGGASGHAGNAGVAGASGHAGSAGAAGSSGQAGSAGAAGSSGQAGSAGAAGSSGQAGSAGAAGSSGHAGSAGAGGGTVSVFEQRISDSGMDAWCDKQNGGTDSNHCTQSSCGLAFGDASFQDHAGFQWKLDIPKGASIVKAHIEMTVTGINAFEGVDHFDGFPVVIRVEDVDDATIFTGAKDDISCGKSRNYWDKGPDATVNWSIPKDIYKPSSPVIRTPDITKLIQHVVNRKNWSGGNVVSIAIWGEKPDGDDYGEVVNIVDSFENPGNSALLHVEYK